MTFTKIDNLGFYSNFTTTFGLFGRDFRHQTSPCPPRRY
jgi:hypothetical protein